MRLLVTGRKGQLVRSLCERAGEHGIEVLPMGRPLLDLAQPGERTIAAIEQARPDAIVSAAAYTQVDQAESEPDLAFAVNEGGARNIARAAHALRVPLIHISTDYVFDGSKSSPYIEDDTPNPISVYGASKLAGERAVLAEHDNCAVLRTAWVYSPFGSNFLKTMLRLAQDRREVRVVADQYGNPTSALDLADGVLAVARRLVTDNNPALRCIFHMAGYGAASRAEFAEEIYAASAEIGGATANVIRISTAEYPTAATRPANARLDSSRLARTYDIRLPEWRSSLKHVVARMRSPA